ncbi:hypothetical protein KFE25_009681 [Diacronema lutheri]|uniref:Uncharacterized protein n=1 Tax=Diacronema lutheri TaxID=2081491 RepID=A0A8J6CID7_DIALT|nr:hypothetical protein KFE25_009681 [Diacronema lutheri]
MSTTRVVVPQGGTAPPSADVAMGEDAAVGGARPRKAVERKEGTQPYIVRERVASGSFTAVIAPDDALPPEPRRDGKERSSSARPASRVGTRAGSGGRDDLRGALRGKAGVGSGGGGGGGGAFRAGSGSADLRSAISKTRRTSERGGVRGARGVSPHVSSRRHAAPARLEQPRASGGGGGVGYGHDSSRADGEWKRDLFAQLGA